jgi:hypothetical protein
VLNALPAPARAAFLTIRSGLPTAKLQAAWRRPSRTCGEQRLRLRDARCRQRRPRGDGAGLPPPACRLGSRVDREARLLAELQPDLVLSDVAYLPLAGAARAGIPSVAMCSLNWAELFAHFFASETGRGDSSPDAGRVQQRRMLPAADARHGHGRPVTAAQHRPGRRPRQRLSAGAARASWAVRPTSDWC